MTPYQIRPAPNPRIPVNLQYFLTDPNKEKAPTSEVTIQTDEFQPRPDSPEYIPKKTGIDTATQVEDYELFNFEREVEPIVNVIITKTLEQSFLEIEEEEELKKMNNYKLEFYKKRAKDKDKWKRAL